MFFRMLKKDLASKRGLNAILLLFMCVASIITVCSAIMLWINTCGAKKDLEKVNATEVIMATKRDLNDYVGSREKTIDLIKDRDSFKDVELSETIFFNQNAVDFEGYDEGANAELKDKIYFAYDQSAKHNRATDLDGNFFELQYGTIAVPEYVHKYAKVNIGDKVKITTQMGNIYEFQVAVITKDPAMGGEYRLFFNKEDYEILKKDSPVIYDVYMVDLSDTSTFDDQLKIYYDYSAIKENDGNLRQFYLAADTSRGEEVAIYINTFMFLFSILVILMVFMTVSFTIKSAIKNEEKELGMLKAIGVESASFNWLFAAKYLVCSAVAAVVGVLGGIPLSMMYVKYIAFGQLKPALSSIISIACIASLISFAVIIFFVAISLRRMKKISVMDVITGENRGERFKKLPGIFLHRLKKINIPFYLALTDLTNRIRRYKFLIMAYTMGITMVIALLEIYNTVYSTYWIEKYWARPAWDFAIDLPAEEMDVYYQRGGSIGRAYDIINDELKKAGIPAHVGYYFESLGKLRYGDKGSECSMQFADATISQRKLYKGVLPKLRNEVLLNALDAKEYGINVGDTINLEYDKYNEDGISYKKVNEDFVVVGLIDVAFRDLVYMSEAFDGAVGKAVAGGARIYAPKEQHAAYIEQMREMYGASSIRDKDEETKYTMLNFKTVCDMILWIFIPILIFMLILVTVLYQSVNMSDEKTEIAFLKCSGFTDGKIKEWQVMRSIMVAGMSSILAIVVVNSAVLMGFREIFGKLRLLVAYTPNRNIPLFYVCAPILIIIMLAVTVYSSLGRVSKIRLSELR